MFLPIMLAQNKAQNTPEMSLVHNIYFLPKKKGVVVVFEAKNPLSQLCHALLSQAVTSRCRVVM
jgi:hypothetical protein